MAEARDSNEWNRTAEQLSMLANVNNDPKKNPKGYESRQFHPYLRNRPKSKLEREAEAMAYHMNSLADVPEEKFDEAFDRFFNRGKDGSERESNSSGPSGD